MPEIRHSPHGFEIPQSGIMEEKMKLVIGGYAQGKLAFVLEHYGADRCRVWDGVLPKEADAGMEMVFIDHFHNWVKGCMLGGGCPEAEVGEFLKNFPDCVIISDEIGNGIVPVEAFERQYREQTGRILVELAGKAEEVVRVICGIGQKIK